MAKIKAAFKMGKKAWKKQTQQYLMFFIFERIIWKQLWRLDNYVFRKNLIEISVWI